MLNTRISHHSQQKRTNPRSRAFARDIAAVAGRSLRRDSGRASSRELLEEGRHLLLHLGGEPVERGLRQGGTVAFHGEEMLQRCPESVVPGRVPHEKLFKGLRAEDGVVKLRAFFMKDADVLTQPISLACCVDDLCFDVGVRLLTVEDCGPECIELACHVGAILLEAEAVVLGASDIDHALQRRGTIVLTDSRVMKRSRQSCGGLLIEAQGSQGIKMIHVLGHGLRSDSRGFKSLVEG